MQRILWLFLFILIITISIFFHFTAKEKQIVFDDEQKGLNEQIVIKFSHVVAENTPKGLAAQKFAEIVHKKTNNRVKVEVFANASLYSDVEEVEALKQGMIQMIAPATTKISSIYPKLNLLDLPYAFSDYDAVYEALNGEIGQHLLAEVNEGSLMGLAFWSNGFKQITSNQGPLTSPESLTGQHFRIMPSTVIEKQFKTVGAVPNPIPFNLTYQNLEDGTIDGQENTLSNIYSKQFFNVQKHLTISNHGFLSYLVLTNKEFWDKLPKDIQVNIREAMDEAALWNQGYAVKMNEAALEKIKQNSTINIYELTDEEKEKWRSEFETVYDEFEPIIGEKLMTNLKELREK